MAYDLDCFAVSSTVLCFNSFVDCGVSGTWFDRIGIAVAKGEKN